MKLPTTGMSIPGPAESTLSLGEYIGAGAFGVVFKARDVAANTLYAVKFPQYALFGGEMEKTAFLAEIQVAQEIQHPNVVRVLHVEIDSPDLPPYLVMEYLEEGTLKSYLDQLCSSGTVVDTELLRAWTNDLVEGISAINAKIIHRDLKPDNILLDKNHLKIGDFGLSKVVNAMTRSRTFKGGQHILYMAPEGWRSEKNTIQLDMYAMGIVFYEIASLKYPYKLPQDLSDYDAVRQMHLYQQPLPIQTGTSIPVGFSHIIYRLLEKNPGQRFSNWSEVKHALDTVWTSQGNHESSPRSVISSLLHITEQRHKEFTRQQIEEQKHHEELQEQQHLDAVQKQRLLQLIEREVAEYNEHCHFKEKITIDRIGSDLNLYLPFGGVISLKFFGVDPPLNLKVGKVRCAAVLQDSDKIGLNFLLCRDDTDDLYGTWKVCRVRNGVASSPMRPEPFGFDNPKDIHQIEFADQALTRYRNDFSDQLQDVVLQLAKDSMIRMKEAQGKQNNRPVSVFLTKSMHR